MNLFNTMRKHKGNGKSLNCILTKKYHISLIQILIKALDQKSITT
jgi:hypothetical protein